MLIIPKGTKFWNDDRTEGYEILIDVYEGMTKEAAHVRSLGAAPLPKYGEKVPKWLDDQIVDFQSMSFEVRRLVLEQNEIEMIECFDQDEPYRGERAPIIWSFSTTPLYTGPRVLHL